jgi:thioredoxin 1
VICLCAAWCRTCDAYRPLLSERAQRDPGTRHLWIDVEDDADLLGDLDIETFPTLLIAHDGVPRFFGPLLPHIGALDQTLARLAEGMAPPLPAAGSTAADDLARLARLVPASG